MSTALKHSWRRALVLAAIFATLVLGCDRTEPLDAPQGTSADATVIAERLAECLAAMFPQMSREELEREAQTRIADLEAENNAEAFVEQFCGNGQARKNATSRTPAVTIPPGPTAMRTVSVGGLGVTRAEMEEFFLAKIEEEPAAFTSVGKADGKGKLTKIEWDGWGTPYYKSGKYALLAGEDENIYGVVFAYEAHGQDQPGEHEIRSLLERVAPTKNTDLESRKSRSYRYGWIFRYFKDSSCDRGNAGGGLSNILTSPHRNFGPAPTRTPYAIVQNSIEMRLDCKAGIYVVSIKAVGSTGAIID